jgi:hypothetical protein
MNNQEWREDLDRLLVRFSGMGITPDTYSMTSSELWGVYCGLRRLARGRV